MTELTLAAPPEGPGIPLRVVVWTLIAVLVLLGGLAGSLWALKKTQSVVRQRNGTVLEAPTNSAPAR